jgi:DnaJ-class molecular chaperone
MTEKKTKTCGKCGGSGKVRDNEGTRWQNNWGGDGRIIYKTCPKCGGSGRR